MAQAATRNSLPVSELDLGKIQASVPFKAYSEGAGINASGLKDMLRSPGHYKHLSLHPSPPSPAMQLGTLVHMLVLEPERAEFIEEDGKHVIVPSDDMISDAVRHTRAAFDKAKAMAEAVWANPVAKRLLSHGKSEQSVWWKDPTHNVTCKARIDHVATDTGTLPMALDLKTASDAGRDAFAKAAANNRYDLQAAHYCEAGRETGAFDVNRFAFVVVQNTPPHYCVVYFVGAELGEKTATDRFLNIGSEWREYAMRLYTRSIQTQQWAFPEAARIDLPAWAKSPQDSIDRGELADA